MTRTSLPLWVPLVEQRDFNPDTHTAVAADGVHVTFRDGQRRLCAKSGLWNANLGFGNRAIAKAVAAALESASYLPLFRSAHTHAIEAAEALLELPAHPFGKVIFSTSGSAANDAVMKLARQYCILIGEPERKLIVGLKGSYHGLTYGSQGLSGDDLGQPLYGVDTRNIRHVRFDDGGAELENLMRREGYRVAAVVVEPVLGSGAEAVPADFITALLAHREGQGFLLVADEVATGFGRIHSWFVTDEWPEAPDVIVTSKGLTNGTSACAALLVGTKVTETFDHTGAVFVHGETQAGTPAACAAILATIGEMAWVGHERLTRNVSVGLYELIRDLQGIDGVGESTGRGCMRGLKLYSDTGVPLHARATLAVVNRIHGAGAIVQPGPGRIQLLPALTYMEEDFQELHAAIAQGIREARRDGVFA
ncbi:daptide-type RiPP biosynthesis aminotransferase [Paenarthrobacter sp. YJN-5]|uniref:daptide-type RiPP biosynthesis aminotransferase n=1 Tax=Paenarthrobacter sp. YJN-5 TaxID=2735316 RepID=UPI0018787B57|nr:daptide-type RiPP biosynthesis aminotransferase [Paenarthrobacter sp. YJN-5]QOT15764.1 aspartate aminotransferase family protein [Paenarthrobacter sp. YJN-5]